MKTIPFDTYLHVTENRSGETWVVEVHDDTPLDLRSLLETWVASEWGGDVAIDGDIMPRMDGDYYGAIFTDNRQPGSVVVWEGAGFYLKLVEEQA